MEITAEAAREAYRLGKQVYLGNLGFTEAIADLRQRTAINPNSASGTVRNVVHILKGERFARTNSVQSTSIFLASIFEDFGHEEQSCAISAIEQHLEYYQSRTAASQRSLRELCDSYKPRIAPDLSAAPSVIRILPMSSGHEFEGLSLEQLQSNFFLQELPARQDCLYYFRRQAINAPPGTLILFQSGGHLIASAIYLGRGPNPNHLDYAGSLRFDVHSIMVFRPLNAEQVREIWPSSFRGFSQAKADLDREGYAEFRARLKEVRYPFVELQPIEGDRDTTHPEVTGVFERQSVRTDILRRRGQSQFRLSLLARFAGKCVITGCTLVDVLEAAHIRTESGRDDHSPDNGLLLRSDIHTMFDLHLLGIDEELRVHLHPRARSDEYRHLEGTTLRCDANANPDRSGLRTRFELFRQRNQS